MTYVYVAAEFEPNVFWCTKFSCFYVHVICLFLFLFFDVFIDCRPPFAYDLNNK
jgi:hypothetical protein